jgi:hypothetical protein
MAMARAMVHLVETDVTGRCEPATGYSAVVRRAGGVVYHRRCGQPLDFRGIRAQQEADFYCFTCTGSVTVPLIVLEQPAPEVREPVALRVVPGGRGRLGARRRPGVTRAA